MPFNIMYYLIGRELAAVDEARASQLAILSSGMLNIPMAMGLVMTSVIAEQEAPVATAGAAPGGGTADGRVTVPDVHGLSAEDAEDALIEAGFVGTLEILVDYSDASERNLVIDQDPSAGSSIAPDDDISLVVGLGEGITVPSVETMHLDKATEILEDLGLEVVASEAEELEDGLPVGHVARQDPEAGTKVAPEVEDGTVTLFVVSGAAFLPDVEGRPEEPVPVSG